LADYGFYFCRCFGIPLRDICEVLFGNNDLNSYISKTMPGLTIKGLIKETAGIVRLRSQTLRQTLSALFI